jgi:hypothetical protein
VNQIKDAKVVPFTGEPAIQFAQKYVTRERTQQAVQGRLQGLFAAQKDKIKFSKEFAGAAPAITGPGAARAAGPAPAAPTSAAAPTSGGA